MATKTQPRAHPKSSGGGRSPSEILIAAARRWHVPLWALVGVKLMETGNSTSSANPFQFEPGTARSAGVHDVNNFSESANGAAKLLAGYHRKFGSWGAAFEAYNGGPGAVGGGYAYSQKQVEAKLAEFGLSKAALGGGGRQTVSFFGEAKGLLDKAFGYALGGVLGGKGTGEAIHEANPGKVAESLNPLGALGSVADFFSMLTSGEFWIRAGEILAGAILLYMGLKNLTGVGASDLPGARPAARAAKVGAVAAVVK